MAVPAEIARKLNAEAQAHAALGCALHGPIGETHLVVANGRLHLFTRESLVGEFTQVTLEGLPKLEPGDFSDTLHVELADGASAELNVPTFDRDNVKAVLAAAAVPVPAPPAAPVPAPPAVLPAEPPATPAPPEAAPPTPREDTDEDDQPGAAPNDEQANKEDAVYHGGETGFIGCLAQTLLFFGAIAALWHLHDLALQGLYGPDNPASREGFIYVMTKGLAVVCGVYAGARLAGLVTRIRRSRNLGGRIEFSRRSVVVVGKDGLWKVSIDTSRPFDLLGTHVMKPRGNASGTNRDEYWYYVRLTQQGQAAALRFLRYSEAPLPSLAGLPVTPGTHDLPEDRTLRMDERTCLQVAARLHKLHEPFAKAASAGDNVSA